jgi:hypothetical protein
MKASYSFFQDFYIPNLYNKMHRFKQNNAAVLPILSSGCGRSSQIETDQGELSQAYKSVSRSH